MKTNLVAPRDETTLIARDAADWLRRLQREDRVARDGDVIIFAARRFQMR